MMSKKILNNEGGFALFATLIVVVLMSALIVVQLQSSISTLRTTTSDIEDVKTFYAAEGGAEATIARLDSLLSDGVLTDSEVDALPIPTLPPFVFSHFDARKIGGISVDPITDGAFAGLYGLNQRVEIDVEACNVIHDCNRVLVGVRASQIPLFQFGVFYDGDLEILPGPAMTYVGPIHTNGNLYLGAGASATFNRQLTAHGSAIYNRKDEDNEMNNVWIYDATGTPIALTFDSRSIPGAEAFKAASEMAFDSRLKTSAFDVDSLVVPEGTTLDQIKWVDTRPKKKKVKKPKYLTREMSSSRGNKTYWTSVATDGFKECTCSGFTYRRRCRHVKELFEELGVK